MTNDQINQAIEQSIRESATHTGDKALVALVDQLDKLRAAGKQAEFRMDNANKRISVVELIKVEVELTEIAEEALQSVDDEDAAAEAERVA